MVRTVSVELPHFTLARTTADQVGLRRLGDSHNPAPVSLGRSALDQARADGAAEAERRFDLRRAEDRVAFDAALAERERRHNEGVATIVAEQLKAAIDEIEARISTEVSRAVARFLSGAIRDRALNELADTVRALTLHGEATRLHVSGPPALLEAVQARLAEAGFAAADLTETDAAELTVNLDDTVIATRIGAWMDRVTAALAEDARG
jgi:hypothetical protein